MFFPQTCTLQQICYTEGFDCKKKKKKPESDFGKDDWKYIESSGISFQGGSRLSVPGNLNFYSQRRSKDH